MHVQLPTKTRKIDLLFTSDQINYDAKIKNKKRYINVIYWKHVSFKMTVHKQCTSIQVWCWSQGIQLYMYSAPFFLERRNFISFLKHIFLKNDGQTNKLIKNKHHYPMYFWHFISSHNILQALVTSFKISLVNHLLSSIE